MPKQTVIYLRYSSVHQRKESLEAQKLKCQQGLNYAGIDPNNALILEDSAQPGDREDRDNYTKLVAMINKGEVAVLCVDQQSRFSRGMNVKAMVKDLVYAGGRFIAVGDGIDTKRQGWEDLVGLKEIHNQMEVRDTGWRVRRSQEQRVEDKNGSAGDYPYGYDSKYVDPAAVLNYHGRGPKPAKEVVICDATAAIVRQVFGHFAAGDSIASIVRRLNQMGETIHRIGKVEWDHTHIRRILSNPKYVGRWVYGRTTTVRNSQGKKKQVAVQPHLRITEVSRPDLRIVDQGVWEACQGRLKQLTVQFGMKPGGKKRGPSADYRLMYPKMFLSGLINCPRCGRRMILSGSNHRKRFVCPKHWAGTCSMAAGVPYDKAEEAIVRVIKEHLQNMPDWMQRAAAHMRQAIRNSATTAPRELADAQAQLLEVQRRIDRLVDALEGGLESSDVRERLAHLQREKEILVQKIAEFERLQTSEVELPEDCWLREQFETLADMLKGDPAKVRVVRSMLGQIQVEEVCCPGKQRGYVRLRVRLNGCAAIAQIASGTLPASVLSSLKPSDPAVGSSQEIVIDLGAPTKMDHWAPQIVKWREQNVPWKEIAQRTDLKLANAYLAYKRHKDGIAKVA